MIDINPPNWLARIASARRVARTHDELDCLEELERLVKAAADECPSCRTHLAVIQALKEQNERLQAELETRPAADRETVLAMQEAQALPSGDRKAYMREYQRRRRAAEKAEKEGL